MFKTNIPAFVFAAVLLSIPITATAQFNKCVINGTVTYQNGPCPSSEVRKEVTAAELNAERQKKLAQSAERPASSNSTTPATSISTPPAGAQNTPSFGNSFRCDGRKYCSQMTSCAEAKYFLANCPGVKMDGDRDGIPCEDRWCH